MRHGPALDREDWHQDDTLRPLSDAGRDKTRAAARGLKYLCPPRVLIATSPLVRAVQTAEIVREVLRAQPVETWEEAALLVEEGADLEPLRRRLTASSTGVLLVGHEPGCSRLLSLLLCGDADALRFDWKKAGAAGVEDGELKWFASPRMLRGLGAT